MIRALALRSIKGQFDEVVDVIFRGFADKFSQSI